MFEPTRDSHLKISPLVVQGEIILCEDPASTPALYGALLAIDDFLATQEGRSTSRYSSMGNISSLKNVGSSINFIFLL